MVKAKTENRPSFRYGRYRIWGDIHYSRYFKIDGQPSVEQIIRYLSPTTNARYLGQSFQGYNAVRKLTNEDHHILQMTAQELPLEPRAKILPEEKLEAALLLGNAEEVSKLVKKERVGIAEERKKYLYNQAPERNPKLVETLQQLYDGLCQICLWHPVQQYNHKLCHAHHIQWLSRGGDDDLNNMVLICPNHHAAIHRVDAPLDFKDFAFDFGTHREVLKINYHIEKNNRFLYHSR